MLFDVALKRAFTPEELGEQECGLCWVRFEAGGVSAQVVGYGDLGRVCPACLEHLHGRNPERFPSLAQFEEARRRYPEPVYSSAEEVMRLEEADDPSVHEAYRASWLSRA
jgi:hypothetical protein